MSESPAIKNRRYIDWQKARKPKTALALFIGTFFGSGLLPKMPGTWGSLFAIPLVWWSLHWSFEARVIFWLALFAVGTWSARVIDEEMRTGDNQNIVVDEAVGMGITGWTLPLAFEGRALGSWIAVFVLFRLFDTTKPFPIGWIDEWSKRKAQQRLGAQSAWFGGFGVMIDDVLAAVWGLLCVMALQRWLGLP